MADPAILCLHTLQYVFRILFQAHDIVCIVRALIETSLEWLRHMLIIDGDIDKLYDNTKRGLVVSALRKKETG